MSVVVSIANRIGLYYPPLCSTNRPRRNSHTGGYGFLVRLELAARVEDRPYKFTISASLRLFYLVDSCFAPCYHHLILHALSVLSICIHGEEVAYYLPSPLSQRRRGKSWKEGWFSKKSCEGVFTWSVLLFITVIDPHTFNSGDA